MCITKLWKKEPEKKTLGTVWKVLIIIGVVAAVCVVLKLLYDKYKERICGMCGECEDEDWCDCLDENECCNCEDEAAPCECDGCKEETPAE